MLSPMLHVRILDAQGVPKMDTFGHADPFCYIQLTPSGSRDKTRVMKNTSSPEWNEEFHYPITDQKTDILKISMLDWNKFREPEPIASVEIPLSTQPVDEVQEHYLEMKPAKGVKGSAQLHIILHVAPPGAVAFQSGHAPMAAPTQPPAKTKTPSDTVQYLGPPGMTSPPEPAPQAPPPAPAPAPAQPQPEKEEELTVKLNFGQGKKDSTPTVDDGLVLPGATAAPHPQQPQPPQQPHPMGYPGYPPQMGMPGYPPPQAPQYPGYPPQPQGYPPQYPPQGYPAQMQGYPGQVPGAPPGYGWGQPYQGY